MPVVSRDLEKKFPFLIQGLQIEDCLNCIVPAEDTYFPNINWGHIFGPVRVCRNCALCLLIAIHACPELNLNSSLWQTGTKTASIGTNSLNCHYGATATYPLQMTWSDFFLENHPLSAFPLATSWSMLSAVIFCLRLSSPQWRILFSVDMLQLYAKPDPGGEGGFCADFLVYDTTSLEAFPVPQR